MSWFQEAAGGAFAFYPDGARSAPRTIDAHFNSAVVVDTDTVFHGVDRVAVVSHGLWQRRYGGDPSILGETVTLGDDRYVVVGVMPVMVRQRVGANSRSLSLSI